MLAGKRGAVQAPRGAIPLPLPRRWRMWVLRHHAAFGNHFAAAVAARH
jgi:hypothetical protein